MSKPGEWVDGSPIGESDHALPVGIEIDVDECGRLERYLVGHMNERGGGCGCCSIIEIGNPNYRIIRWRRVWSPDS